MLESINFSLEDFKNSLWEEVVDSCDIKICNNFGFVFALEAKKAKESGNTSLYEVFLLLHAVNYLWLRPEERYQPFAPIWQGVDGSRSVDLTDLSEDHILKLKEIFPEVTDSEMRSRIGDVIWTYDHRNGHTYAVEAIISYLLSGETFLSTDNFYFGVERITRAIHLAAALGKKSKIYTDVVEKILSYCDTSSSEIKPYIDHLLGLLIEYREGDLHKIAEIAENYAIFYEKKHEWRLARSYWNISYKSYVLCNEKELENLSLLKEAENYVLESEDILNNKQNLHYSVAAYHLRKAIEIYRRIPGKDERITELHVRMVELQEKSTGELSRYTQEFDLKNDIEKAIFSVQGKSFLEAIFQLSIISSSPKKEDLSQIVEQIKQNSVFYSLVPFYAINNFGKVVGFRKSLIFGSEEDKEIAKSAEMMKFGNIIQNATGFVILHTLKQLQEEHKPNLSDFLEITTYNPFIPPGRELIFARGFLLGFQGEFMESLHLLIPQIENSLRYVLDYNNIVTSKINSEGIQEEKDLNTLLDMPELTTIMGDDLIFDLQCCLTSRFGANFRNLLAHGLLSYQSFNSYTSIYIWWLLLRTCCLPLIALEYKEKEANADKEE